MKPRRGFALIAVLWIVTLLAGSVSATMQAVRLTSLSASNRMSLDRGHWAAEACQAMSLAQLDTSSSRLPTQSLGELLTTTLTNGSSCRSFLEEPEARVLEDSLSPELRERVDSLMAARPSLARESILTSIGSGRIDVNAAPPEVLALLPGLGIRGADAIVQNRLAQGRLSSMADILNLVDGSTRDSIDANLRALERIIIFAPTCIVLRSVGMFDGRPPLRTIESVLVPLDRRMAVVRRRLL